jgi:hypothetical protein
MFTLWGDTAFYDHNLLRKLDRRHTKFAVSADVSEGVRDACRKVPKDAWTPLLDSAGKPTEKEIARKSDWVGKQREPADRREVG